MKSALDYFPLDVHLDGKFELLEAEFGLAGFAVAVKLFQAIYGGEGYFLKFDDEMLLIFSRRNGIAPDEVKAIVQRAVERGLFDAKIFTRHGVLTSRGIQRRYFEAAKRRKEVAAIGEYLLIGEDELGANVAIDGYKKCAQDEDVCTQNECAAGENSCENPQSKANETEIKGQDKKARLAAARKLFEELWAQYPVKRGSALVADAQKLKLFAIGREQMERAISRYLADKPAWQEYKNGSTFFNTGYVDYLDENYRRRAHKAMRDSSMDIAAIEEKLGASGIV